MKTKDLALWSLILSIAGFFVGITGVVGLIMGIIALKKYKTESDQEGKPLAIVGVVLGAIQVVGLVLAIIGFFLFMIMFAGAIGAAAVAA